MIGATTSPRQTIISGDGGDTSCNTGEPVEDFLLDLEMAVFEMIEDYLQNDYENETDLMKERIVDYVLDFVDDLINMIDEDIDMDEEDFALDGMDNMDDFLYAFVQQRVQLFFESDFHRSLLPPFLLKMGDTVPRAIPSFELPPTINETILSYIQIDHLQKIPQPQQRTEEWFTFRHSLMSASNIYKIFSSPAQLNSLILEKCKPVEFHYRSSNKDSTLHWGQKYEPLSIRLFENKYATSVGEFGCIRHPRYPCIGASPDGIVVGKNHFGRMVEVKNIVNREINGNPLEAYWIQMQIQMEVCDLNLCDFVETRFKECTKSEWLEKKQTKGAIVSSFSLYEDEAPNYIYHILEENGTEGREMAAAEAAFVERMTSDPTKDVTWWYLDTFSCVVVPRNRLWFQNAVEKILETWKIIEYERENGYEHRFPKKREKKPIYHCIVKLDRAELNAPVLGNFDEE